MKILKVIRRILEMRLSGENVDVVEEVSGLTYRELFGAKTIDIGIDVDSLALPGIYVCGKDNYDKIGDPDFVIDIGESELIGVYPEYELSDAEKFARKHLGETVKLVEVEGCAKREGRVSGFNLSEGCVILSSDKGVWTFLNEDDIVLLPGKEYLYIQLSDIVL